MRDSERGPRRPAFLTLAAAGALLAGLGACYPGEITNVSQTDVVVTAYDDGYDYASKRTFALPDTVVEVCDLVDPGDVPISCDEESRIDYDHAFDAQYVSAVRSGLTGLGWTEIPLSEVSETNRPDVVVLTMVAVNEWTSYSYYPLVGLLGLGRLVGVLSARVRTRLGRLLPRLHHGVHLGTGHLVRGHARS